MLSTRAKALLAAVAAIFFLLVLAGAAADFAVDLFWFRSLALEEVFWTRWRAELAVRGVVGLLAGVFVFLNLWIVSRAFGTLQLRRRYGNIEIAERLPQGYVVTALGLLSLFSAWWISGGAGDGATVLAYLRPAPWGETDPLFGRDLSFYIFHYPLLSRAQTLTGVLLFWTLLLSLAAYAASSNVRWADAGPQVSVPARRHLGMLVAGLFLVLAWSLWLGRYELLLSGRGIGGALGYTDVHARLPARQITALLAVVAAGTVGYGTWYGSLRVPAVGIGVLLIGALGLQGAWPGVVQRLVVEPDELARETPYIEMNLRSAREGYGLAGLDRRPFPYEPGGEPGEGAVRAAVAEVPLWDVRPILQTYQAQQALFRYYDFVSAHYDRYGPPGEAEQVVISVRELDVTRLEETAQTWQNRHLNFVRGEGVVVSPASRMTPGGEPPYFVSDIFPPRISPAAPPDLQLTDPAVYFGERSTEYIVLTEGREGRARAGAEEGLLRPAGVQLDALWKKLLYAWSFQSRNLLLSGEVTPESQIVYRRLVRERVAGVAPFLHLPSDPRGGAYPVVHEGRIVWIVDAFTTTAHFPLAPVARFGQRSVRYVRNSVKATVDAVTGEVHLYVVDEADPIIASYRRVFPGLFRPLDALPEGLQRHLRFPPSLFTLQTNVLRSYHLRDARAFYHKEDVWDIPTETYRDERIVYDPVYALLPLPDGEGSEYVLATPYVAAGRQNMTAWYVMRNDLPHYGEQILYEFPRDELIPGPQQVEAMIDQDPNISEQLALWKRRGSDVIRGHMIVVPVDGSLVYIEPIYLEAQESAIPQLERVIAASGRRVAMRPTLEGALTALLAGEPAAARVEAAGGETPSPGTPAAARPAGLQEARVLLERAEAQLRAGDWAGFGETWDQLRRALETPEGP